MTNDRRTPRGRLRRRPRRSGAVRWLRRAALLAVLGPIALTTLLRWVNPPTTAFMLQASDHAAETRSRAWVGWEELSPHLPIAVVAAEDQKFPTHGGFDVDAIRQALVENQSRDQPRGASTISQQLIKNLFLWPGRSLARKGLEAYLTIVLEALVTKRRILEMYLNVVEFGPGVYGVDAASRRYFGKPPSEVDAEEAALLAAVLPNPKRLRIEQPSAYVRGRARAIGRQVRLLGGSGYLRGL